MIKEYNNNGATTNCFNQTFEEAIKLYVSERHLESLKKLKDFILEKDKNYNLSDEWLKGFESNIRENAKKFIEIFKEKELVKDIKQLSETLDISLLEKIGVDKVNEVVICRILECNNLNLTKTQDFFNSLKEALKISYANGENSLERLLKLGDAKLSADEDFWRIKTLNFLNKRDPKRAKDTATKLLDINQSSKNHLLYGLVLSEANELDAAVSEYQKAYEIEKSDSNLLALAEFMDVKLGKRNEAVNYLEASRSINGCSEAVCLTLVEIYLQTQQFDKLAPLYEELYELTKDTSYLDKQIKILVFFKKFNSLFKLF